MSYADGGNFLSKKFHKSPRTQNSPITSKLNIKNGQTHYRSNNDRFCCYFTNKLFPNFAMAVISIVLFPKYLIYHKILFVVNANQYLLSDIAISFFLKRQGQHQNIMRFVRLWHPPKSPL